MAKPLLRIMLFLPVPSTRGVIFDKNLSRLRLRYHIHWSKNTRIEATTLRMRLSGRHVACFNLGPAQLLSLDLWKVNPFDSLLNMLDDSSPKPHKIFPQKICFSCFKSRPRECSWYIQHEWRTACLTTINTVVEWAAVHVFKIGVPYCISRDRCKENYKVELTDECPAEQNTDGCRSSREQSQTGKWNGMLQVQACLPSEKLTRTHARTHARTQDVQRIERKYKITDKT